VTTTSLLKPRVLPYTTTSQKCCSIAARMVMYILLHQTGVTSSMV
jgi:hypothetical protein